MAHREPGEDEGRSWGDASISQGVPEIMSNPPDLGERRGIAFSFIALRRN